MLVGFSAYSLRFSTGMWVKGVKRRMDVWDLIDVAKRVNADGIMFNPAFIPRPQEESLRKLAKESEESNLYIELETYGTDPKSLKRIIDYSEVLGAEVMRTFIGGVTTRHEVGLEGWKRMLRAAANNLREVSTYAKSKGVKIAVENHGDLRAGELLELLRAVSSEWVGVCFDTGNQIFLLEDPIDSAEALAPYVFTTHIKEYRVLHCPGGILVEGCRLFEGDIPNKEIVTILRKHSPMGRDLHLNLEVALERKAIPFLDPKFIKNLGEVSVSQLLKALRYAGGWTEDVGDFTFSEEILTREIENLRISVERAKREWG